MYEKNVHLKLDELKSEIAEVKGLEIAIGRLLKEDWTEQEGPTPFPSITDLREWDLTLLQRYRPFYMPYCDVCCLCTMGKCDLTAAAFHIDI